jgi:hypothetical protein
MYPQQPPAWSPPPWQPPPTPPRRNTWPVVLVAAAVVVVVGLLTTSVIVLVVTKPWQHTAAGRPSTGPSAAHPSANATVPASDQVRTVAKPWLDAARLCDRAASNATGQVDMVNCFSAKGESWTVQFTLWSSNPATTAVFDGVAASNSVEVTSKGAYTGTLPGSGHYLIGRIAEDDSAYAYWDDSASYVTTMLWVPHDDEATLREIWSKYTGAKPATG